jgi:SAM-dependent methyltransferase
MPAPRHDLAMIDIAHMRGLEIGPLATPRVHKEEGPVRYLDHASAAELREKYATNQGMRDRLDRIVDVDYVIGGDKSISDVVAPDAPFDYVIGSHVIEHIPDPVSWLADVATILSPGGIVSLVVPDKRYCFDINRALTDASDIVDAYLRQLRRPSYRQAYDFFSQAITVDTGAVWAGTADYTGVVRTDFPDADVASFDACKRMQTSDEFVDVHCHVFTPDSFLALFEKLARLGLIDYEVAAFVPTPYNTFEFYVSLRLLDASQDRAALLARQLASVARCGAPAPVADRGRRSDRSAKAFMEVSQLEGRALVFKRKSLESVRSAIRRARRSQ